MGILPWCLMGKAVVCPQCRTNSQRAAQEGSRLRRESQQKLQGLHHVVGVQEQVPLLTHAGAHHVHFTVLQVAQAAMDDSSGTAGGSGSEIILLQNQGPYATPGAFTGDRHAGDAAADYHYVKLAVEELMLVLTHGKLDGCIYSGDSGKNFR